MVDHPLVKHKLTLMRREETSTANFRRLVHELSLLLAYEALRDLQLGEADIQTPMEPMRSPVLEGKKLVLVAILRAGLGLVEGMLQLVPSARVGHIGLQRDHATLQPREYYFNMPGHLDDRDVVVCDPMLATGNSAVAAFTRLKEARPRSLRFVCLVACPEGLAALAQAHPDVRVYTASVDRGLNERGYIVPGLGDAGDRLFGTK